MTDITLSEQQQRAIGHIARWYDTGDKPYFTLGGFAGTGKTTVIKYLLNDESLDLGKVIVASFTGKACSVLIKKGVQAQTLHSLMYRCYVDDKGKFHISLRDELEARPDFIIVDEASMVSKELFDDLMSFDVPTLFVGDPGQLPPVGDPFNLMDQPKYTLDQIHRQAAENPIIQFSLAMRKDNLDWMSHYQLRKIDDLKITTKADYEYQLLDKAFLASFNQILVAFHKQRKPLNELMRIKTTASLINVGEKLIVLRNNYHRNVFNGMFLTVDRVIETYDKYILVSATNDLGHSSVYPIWREPFVNTSGKINEAHIPEIDKKPAVYCDYGYAITCHKSQGSEWDNVLVLEQKVWPGGPWKMSQWRYTAITRAAKRLTYVF